MFLLFCWPLVGLSKSKKEKKNKMVFEGIMSPFAYSQPLTYGWDQGNLIDILASYHNL